MSRGKWTTLKLHQLRLDQENYRLGPQATQRDAIRAMIDDQGSKLVRLAKDILQMDGVSPGEPIWVVPSGTRGQYIVEEGNRRVTALKLMETPALADGTPVARQFRRLAKTYAENPLRELDARLFETREDVLPWKRRRHMTAGSGVGLSPWKTLAKGRANRDLGLDAPRSLAVVEFFADDRSEQWAEILEALDGRWTTVDRVLNAAPFRDILGVLIDPKTSVISFENGDDKAGADLLKRVLAAMAAPDFEFAAVEDKDDRKAFIERFSPYSVKAKAGASPAASAAEPAEPSERATDAAPSEPAKDDDSESSPQPQPEPDQPDEPTASASRREATDANRKTLAPGDGPRVLAVQGARLGPLYTECRKIKVKGNENAAAFLVRVFIELSSEALLQEKAVKIPPSLLKKGITKWDDYKVKLSDKITAVAFYLDPSDSDKVFQQARVMVKTESPGPFSITTLHAYFHNRHYLPDADAIRQTWDGWETYLGAVHLALNEA